MIEIYEEILSLVEEYINELNLDTMQSSNSQREENWKNSLDDYLKASKEGDNKKQEEENLKSLKARNKLYKNTELMKKRVAKKVAAFKDKLINKKPQTARETLEAGSDHDNAQLNQYLRNKLEKSLAVSEACLNDILTIIEGDIIDFQAKRKEKVLDRNAKKMARMMKDGSLNAVRVLPNNELMGDPVAVKMVKDIQKENDEVRRAARKEA